MFDNEEEWRPIAEFVLYVVSNHGRVKHVDRIETRATNPNLKGFPVVLLSVPGIGTRYTRQVNGLVANAFLGDPFYAEDRYVWHKDGNLLNCHVENLMWERRDRVLEWNDMHRTMTPKYDTPRVKNNRTGLTYENAFECAMAEKVLESAIVWKVERQASHIYDDRARYRYV